MNVHLFSFIRDEAYLLKRWIPFHASIIGLSNIHIIDHKSKNSDCLSLLQQFKNQGLDVIKTPRSFKKKHKLLSNLMREYKSEADILIALDADEFLCLAESSDKMDANPESIRNYLDTLSVDGKKYAFHVYEAVLKQFEYDDPLLDMQTFEFFKASEDASGPNQQTKTFFPAMNFAYTDQGNHKGRVLMVPNDQYHVTKLAIAHFHLRGFQQFQRKLNKAIDAYDLKSLSPDYVGTGMRWNRWYHQTKDLDCNQKKEWFSKKFIRKNCENRLTSMSEELKNFT